MRRLVAVELTRLRWRRAVLLLVAGAVLLPALIGLARIWDTRPVSDTEKAQIVQLSQGEINACADRPRQYGIRKTLPADQIESRCTDMAVGWQLREPLTLAGERSGGSGMGVVAVLTALLLLAGTTFAGHDWNSGSMSNQLLFESRRGRIWGAKALAVTLSALVIAAAVSTAYWLAMWATMQARDLPMVDGALSDSLAYGLRGAGFAAAAALGGYALTMLFRSTVATIGVLFAVSVAGGLVIAMLGLSEHWQPQKNVAAIVKDGTTYYAEVPNSCFLGVREGKAIADESECDQERNLSLWDGLGYYGLPLLVTAGASVVSFRRRDVP